MKRLIRAFSISLHQIEPGEQVRSFVSKPSIKANPSMRDVSPPQMIETS